MPFLNKQNTPLINPNAQSADRQRRNWNALKKGAITPLITLIANSGLINGTAGLGILLQSVSGLNLASTGLAITTASTGTGLSISGNILQINVDGSTTSLNTLNQIVAATGSGSISAATGPAGFLGWTAASGTLTAAFTSTPTLPEFTTVSISDSNTGNNRFGLYVSGTFASPTSVTGSDAYICINSTTPTGGGSGNVAALLVTVNGSETFAIQRTGNILGVGNIQVGTATVTGTLTCHKLMFSAGVTGNVISLINNQTLALSSTASIQASGNDVIDGNGQVYFPADTVAIDDNLHFVGSADSNPSIAAGTGAGTSPTVSITGNDNGGKISVLTGTVPAGSNAIIAAVTFSISYTNTPSTVILTPANAAALGLILTTGGVFPSSLSTTGFNLNGAALGLTGSTTYLWNYFVLG